MTTDPIHYSHYADERTKKTCVLYPDHVLIKDNGYRVELRCALGHIISNYSTDGIVQARVQAQELARVHQVRIIEQ